MLEKEVYSIEEISEILKVSYETVYKMVRDNKIKAVKVGVQWRVRREEVERVLVEGA